MAHCHRCFKATVENGLGDGTKRSDGWIARFIDMEVGVEIVLFSEIEESVQSRLKIGMW